jgi:hypothetical protein
MELSFNYLDAYQKKSLKSTDIFIYIPPIKLKQRTIFQEESKVKTHRNMRIPSA